MAMHSLVKSPRRSRSWSRDRARLTVAQSRLLAGPSKIAGGGHADHAGAEDRNPHLSSFVVIGARAKPATNGSFMIVI